jgi:hypothetical protein
MPLNRMMPDKPTRVAQNNTNTVNANSDSPRATIWTVPINRKYTLYAIGTDQNAANVRLQAFHIQGGQSVQLLDIPTQRLSTDERVVPMYEIFLAGEALTVGLLNGTGAGITPQLYVYYTDEAA